MQREGSRRGASRGRRCACLLPATHFSMGHVLSLTWSTAITMAPSPSAAKPACDSPLPRNCGPSTLAVHAGEERQKLGDSITDPIVCAATYTFANTQAVIDFIEQKQPREEYGRYGNPGERVVERKLAALEGGEDAVLFASGMAAIVGLLMAKLNAGDEVIFFDECYHRSREFCAKHMSRFGVVTHQVKACDYDAMEAAINAAHAAADQRVADQSALERRRSGTVRRHRQAARRRDADRCDAGHAVQRAADRSTASTTCCTRPPSIWPATTTCWPA